jgi:hypothetical protein
MKQVFLLSAAAHKILRRERLLLLKKESLYLKKNNILQFTE